MNAFEISRYFFFEKMIFIAQFELNNLKDDIEIVE